MKNKKISAKRVICYIVFALIYILALLIRTIVSWSLVKFDTDVSGIIFTLSTPLAGTDSGIIDEIIKKCLPIVAFAFLPYVVLVILDVLIKVKPLWHINFKKHSVKIDIRKLCRVLTAILCCFALVSSLIFTVREYDLISYAKNRFSETKIYREYYVDPSKTSIECKEGKNKNLICIYLESMETAYASVEEGGYQQINLIENLTNMAHSNISFSNTDRLGGFYSPTGTTYTMSALFATNAGVPYSFPVHGNDMNQYKKFASGITTMGDVLASKGYVQKFLCGSDARYAGRDTFFKQHGEYKIFDLYTAREKGYIPEDYYVWWGFEDIYLYQIAKDEITQLAAQNKPFNFTMLTVDTHFPDGYICEKCPTDYDSVAENVLKCADNQIAEFIDWCTKQDFYKDTVIVLIGDHPRMDTVLVNDISSSERTVYNCFINAEANGKTNINNRTFTALDIMPTILSAMGYEIEGDRLGLGTNLFSDKKTLAEEFGLEYLQNEFSKSSTYYVSKFS